ncbi:MAG: aminotransferase class I/II-fold pyridoxal phosphate-dependent enzyme [Clostridia bacterium]|jgi:dTDP-4-amino-4,6-dideoxygalactose transaminase|nr:aminotransferase class I/II-fold pyridoxal phosphate-dependent enzyme [Clostridia bacterium]
MAKLAIKGGKPTIPEGLKIKWPVFDDADKKALIDVLESGHWCSLAGFDFDSKVAQFEREFAKWIGTKYAIATNNGTSALVVAIKAGGIEAGDEVIIPAVTFVASATAVILANAIPIFVDIDPETYQISPKAVHAAITDKTKAIMPVHYGGYPANMDHIMEIAKEHNLLVIEDAAEAHGSEWRGKRVGSIGDMGCFSFQMGKPLTCGEGGIVTTSNEDLMNKCSAYGDFGRRSEDLARFSGAKPALQEMVKRDKYVHYLPAGNSRLSEFLGALLLVQLSRLDEQTEIRYKNGEYFASQLEKVEGLRALKRDPRITKRGYYFYFLRYDASKWDGIPRDKFMQALVAEGVPGSRAHNNPVYRYPIFRNNAFGRTGCPTSCSFYGKKIDYSKVSCPVAERVYQSEIIALGKDFLLEKENVDKILEAICKIRENIGELK